MEQNIGILREDTNQIKGIAILLVLLGHSRMWFQISNIIPNRMTTAGAWGVAIFLTLSGYGLTESFFKKGLSISFIKRRVIKVILPYAAVSTLWFIVDFIAFHQTTSIKNVITTLLGVLLYEPYLDPTMWYITFMLFWYVVFFIIFLLPVHKGLKVAILLLVAFLLQHNTINLNSNWEYNYFTFPIGVLISYLKPIIFNKNSRIIINNTAIIVLLIISPYTIEFSNYTEISIAGICVTLWVITLISMLDYKSKILGFLGYISFEIYLLEGVIGGKYREIIGLGVSIRAFIAYLFITICLAYVFKRLQIFTGKISKKIIYEKANFAA